MASKVDLTGQTFGKLIVIKEANEFRNRAGTKIVRWICKCECGNIIEVRARSLKIGHTKSCGCLHKEVVSNIGKSHFLGNGIAAINNLFTVYKRGARYRNLDFNLTKDQFKNLILNSCYYCGDSKLKSKWTRNKEVKYNSDFNYNGIDRVNNDKGYLIDNVVTSCVICNRMKLDLNKEYFFDTIKKIYERHKLNEAKIS